jgi:lipopolysaccharide export system protein LptA
MKYASRQAKRVGILRLIAAVVVFAAAGAAFADGEAVLTAESLSYDSNTGWVAASGNIHFTSPDGELFSDRGGGDINGKVFVASGNVRGSFKRESVEITCEAISLSNENESERRINASGDVVLTRLSDRLSAQSVMWEIGGNSYKAEGNVLGTFEDFSIDSDMMTRSGDQFWASGIREYMDRERGVRLSSRKANGVFDGREIVELITEGSVSIKMSGKNGEISTVTGNKGVYSLARGTIVVTGNARIDRGDHSLKASSVVYHLASGRVEALGQPTLMFGTPAN